MKILIIGNGGREAAIGWKLKQDNPQVKLFFSKGNATTEDLGTNIIQNTIPELVEFAKKEEIDLTIVGPEAPLVEGIVDTFKDKGLKVFGPSRKAATLEGSKAFSKKFMQDYKIKTAKAATFDSFEDAEAYVIQQSFPIVIKASGLAGGKGVVICEDLEEATAVLESFMIRRIHGDAGIQVVIEEFLVGFEASIIAFSNGNDIFPCIAVKDYKKVGKGDTGLNTGGMGTVAPSPEFNDMHLADFEKNILKTTINGLKAEGMQFKGMIFFGLMVTTQGCHLLEYNMRFGDPETQVLMPLLENNLLEVIEDCLEEKAINLRFKDQKAVCVVMVSGGYPGNIETGFEITGLDKAKALVLAAGAKKSGQKVLTDGGRVLNVIGLGDSYDDARKSAYDSVHKLHFDYVYYREDIAGK
jgi:phosphoribosylamine---glycine ligase